MLKGLLRKELYLFWNNFRIYLIIIVLFSFLGSVTDSIFMPVYMSILLGMIPINLLSLDENSHWDLYACTFPCPRSALVTAKYAMILGALGFELFALLLSQALVLAAGNAVDVPRLWVTLVTIIILSVITPALLLPFAYRFGTNKGRIAFLVFIVLFSGAFGALSSILSLEQVMSSVQPLLRFLPILFLVFCVLILAGSWKLSVYFYERHEF